MATTTGVTSSRNSLLQNFATSFMTRRLVSAAELPEGPATRFARAKFEGLPVFGFGDTVCEKEQAITGNELFGRVFATSIQEPHQAPRHGHSGYRVSPRAV